jgi:hypothetical protein
MVWLEGGRVELIQRSLPKARADQAGNSPIRGIGVFATSEEKLVISLYDSRRQATALGENIERLAGQQVRFQFPARDSGLFLPKPNCPSDCVIGSSGSRLRVGLVVLRLCTKEAASALDPLVVNLQVRRLQALPEVSNAEPAPGRPAEWTFGLPMQRKAIHSLTLIHDETPDICVAAQ